LIAQNPDPLVFTVGNSYSAPSSSKSYNYILWQPGDFATTYGKRFAVYSKDGPTDSEDPFVRLGVQTLQVSPSTIHALLILGAKIDHDKDSLPGRIQALHAEAYSAPIPANTPLLSELSLEIAQRLAQILNTAKNNPEILQSLISLGRTHPGVMMAMGHAFAIEVPNASIKTYEVRQISPNNTDLRVIGRVTLDASKPISLPAPGRPYSIPHSVDPDLQLNDSPKNHLNVRLRWSTPVNLRQELPKTYGYNLYRVPVTNDGFDPFTITTEAHALARSNATRVNDLPIAASDLFTDAEAGNLAIGPDVFFYADDKNPPLDPFEDGDTFYYYVAARDIAGHPGPLSDPTEITMCDRLPPSQPAILSVDNVFDFSSAIVNTQTGTQHLRVVIRQVPDLPRENSAKKYRVYRWHSATDWQRYGGDPDFNYIGEVSHIPGQTTVYFDDNDFTDLDTDYINANNNGPDTGAAIATNESDFMMGKTVWYTVRAVDDAACDPPNYSGHCGALYGVLRDRVGPDKPTGNIARCFYKPDLESGETETVSFEQYELDSDFSGKIVRVYRTLPINGGVISKIKSFEIQIGNQSDQDSSFQPIFRRVYHYRGPSPYGDVIIPTTPEDDQILRVRIRLDDQSVSDWVSSPYSRDSAEKGSISLLNYLGSVEKICRPIPSRPGKLSLGHYPIGADGSISGITGTVTTNPETREIRVYRRVGKTSPLELIYKSGGGSLPPNIEWSESGPVITNGVEVCYFAQLFDEHGNASPLVRLGCVTIVNDNLPIPLLADAIALPPIDEQGLLQLSWFSDPVGIDRFEVWIADPLGDTPAIDSPDLTRSPQGNLTETLTIPNGEEINFHIYQTPPLTSNFGQGGEFSLLLKVPYDRQFFFAIRAVGPVIPDELGAFSRAQGAFSNIITGSYVEPGAKNQPFVSWPARPLPGSANIEQKISSYSQKEGPFYAVALPPDLMQQEGCSGAILVGKIPSPLVQAEAGSKSIAAPEEINPIEWLFHYRKQVGSPATSQTESIQRFVVYRHQTPSNRFPNARPNLVQVTPLIDRMTFYPDPENQVLRIKDPFFLFQPYDTITEKEVFNVPSSGTFSRIQGENFTVSNPQFAANGNSYLKFPPSYRINQTHEAKTMWIKDTFPVSRGASYQYLIVHFTLRGEIARVIPTNLISH